MGYAGSNTLRVYDPGSGILAGAAMGGATGLGIQQLEYNAQNQEKVANSILQANTVDPQRMVTGDLILKTCCDSSPNARDIIRFEVFANSKVSVFEFARVIGNGPVPDMSNAPRPASASVAAVQVPATSANVEKPAPVKAARTVPEPVASPPSMPAPLATASTSVTTSNPVQVAVRAPLPQGQDGFSAERLAKSKECHPSPSAMLVAKGPGFESYSVACKNGDALSIRCEFGQCRVLQ